MIHSLVYYHFDHLCNITTNALMFLNKYSYIQLNYASTSFTLTQFFVLNLNGWFDLLSNNFLCYHYTIMLLYYYLRLSRTFCLSFGEIYFPLGIFLSCSFEIMTLFWILLHRFETFFNSVFDFITNQIISYLYHFLNHSFWRRFNASVSWTWWRRFWLHLLLKFLNLFLPILLPTFSTKDKNP